MNKGNRASEELKHFTNREHETEMFTRYVNAPEGSNLPVLMFYGVGGIGKTWLTKRLRQMLSESPFVNMPGQQVVPSARLDMDVNSGGVRYHNDPANAYGEIRRQLGVDCPGFDLAYAMLRHKQNIGDEPEFRQGGAFHNAWEFIGEAGSAAANSIPGGNLIVWAAKKVSGRIGREFKDTALGKYLLSAAGNQEYFELHGMDVDDLYRILPQRLGADLDAQLPPRSSSTCRGVLVLDTLEAILTGIENDAQQYERVRWVVGLYEHTNHLLIVMAGRDRLTWGEVDADWNNPACLEQHRVGGLSRHDAETFLGWCGVTHSRLQEAVLRVCVDVETQATTQGDIPYHPYSLGLCADTIVQERNQGIETDPTTYDMAPGDYDKLAQRFLKSLANDAEADWIARLSLPFRFDEAAARHAYSTMSTAAQNVAWKNLIDYSFVTPPDDQGWRTLHPRMREALRKRLATPDKPGDAKRSHEEWRAYWQSRAQNDTDDFAALAWYHFWCLQPSGALSAWEALVERARRDELPDMALHYRLLSWWLPTEVNAGTSQVEVAALNRLGTELWKASLGSRAHNLQRAIGCFEAILRVRTEAAFPEDWAAVQNNLGSAYSSLPTGDYTKNLRRAIDCHRAALRVYTETSFPHDWAMTQNNLGVAYKNLPTGDRSENLRLAIDCFDATLRVYTEAGFPEDWAATQNNLGTTYGNLSTGDRTENLQRAIDCYKAALRVRTETGCPQEWAATQNNLGTAYNCLPTGDHAKNLQLAIDCYQSALSVYTETDFPQDWAMTQNNLGNAHFHLPNGDRATNLKLAIDCYRAALRVRTETEFPQEWAMTQNNLGVAYRNLPTGDRAENLQRAIDCYKAALRVRTETGFPQEWAETQNNLGTAYLYLPTGDRSENLRLAIECFDATLRVYTEAGFPQKWAATQNNIGTAYGDLPTGDPAENLQRAIDCHDAALRVYTEVNAPQTWAAIQNNLGNAYSSLLTGDRTENLQRAIERYEAALRVRTETDFPQDWATTQNNLGNAYFYLPTGDRTANLQRAIDCYDAALRVYTEAGFPEEWATTQNNLGTVYLSLPTGDRTTNLKRAIACFDAALRVRTETNFPYDWALTQKNLAIAYEALGNRAAARVAMRSAAIAYRKMESEQDAKRAEDWLQSVGDA